MDWRAWWATVHWASKSQTQLNKRAHTHTHTHIVSLGSADYADLDYVQSLFESQFSYLENEENNYSNEKMYGKPLEQCLVGSEWSMYDG